MKPFFPLPLFLPLFFALLFGCSSGRWERSSIRNGDNRYDMTKLTYPPSDKERGLKLEIARVGKEVRAYINVENFELPTCEANNATTRFTIAVDERLRTFLIPLLEGKQQAYLTEDSFEYLLQCLKRCPFVTISAGHFSETIDTSNFTNYYNALLRKPKMVAPQSMIRLELF